MSRSPAAPLSSALRQPATAMSASFHLSDIGVEEPVPPVAVPRVDRKEIDKAQFVLEKCPPDDVTYDR